MTLKIALIYLLLYLSQVSMTEIDDLTEKDRTSKKFYAVRGRQKRIEVKWHKILDYNFHRKQGLGNAAKLDSYEEAVEFANSKANLESRCFCFEENAIRDWIRSQGKLAVIIFVAVVANLVLYTLWKLLHEARGFYYCDNYWWETPTKCNQINYVIRLVRDHKSKIQGVLAAQLVTLLGAFMVWLKKLF